MVDRNFCEKVKRGHRHLHPVSGGGEEASWIDSRGGVENLPLGACALEDHVSPSGWPIQALILVEPRE